MESLPVQRIVTSSKRRPCCVCKQTKAFRDQCLRNNDEEVCIDFVLAHKLCLKAKGFRIE